MECGKVPFAGAGGTGGVEGVGGAEELGGEGKIGQVAGHGADLIEGRGVSDEARARDAAVGGFEAVDAAV